jgi:hypothetical protein
MATSDQGQLRCDSSCDEANLALTRNGAPVGFSCELTPTYDQCKDIAIDQDNATRLTYSRYSTDGKAQVQTLLCPLGEWHYDTEAPTSGYAADGSRGVYKCTHAANGFIGGTPPAEQPAVGPSVGPSASPSVTGSKDKGSIWTGYKSELIATFIVLGVLLVFLLVYNVVVRKEERAVVKERVASRA